ncbi:response regulator, partial [Acinetobacter baumannii]
AHVLLAEDNPVNALLARTHLTQMGCTVERASTGEEAAAAGLTGVHDLILMDLRMPGLDGLEATRRLRSAGVSTPVVALTANA